VLRAERIEPKLQRARRVALYTLAPAAAGTVLGLLAGGRSGPVGIVAFVLVAASVTVGGMAIIVGIVLTFALFFSSTDHRR
jgi:hypothetical protein